MDVEKLIEEGARALWKASALNIAGVRDLDAEWGAMSSGDRDPYIIGSRAVLAIALAEAADEDAALTKGDLLLTAGEMTASELRTVRAVLDWRAARLRTLAAQLGGKTDA